MTGGPVLAMSTAQRTRTRWVGRSSILPSSPRAPRWLKFLVLTSSFFGLQLVWSCEMAQASPFLLSLGVSKSAMAVVFLAGPLSGLVAQPLVGVLSDACESRFGRRRPFIVGGVVVSCLAVALLAWCQEVAAWTTTPGGTAHRHLAIGLAIFAVYLVDFSVNVVQAMDRALLVDVVPPADQAAANAWAGRMFGFGAVCGYGLATFDLVKLTGGAFGDEQLKVIACFTIFFVCLTHLVTVTCVEERILISREVLGVNEQGHPALQAFKDIWRTIRTIPRPIQQVFDVQFTSWIGWFPILFFSTTWIAEIYVRSLSSSTSSSVYYPDLASAPTTVQEAATRAGSTGMFWHSIVSFSTSILLPPLIAPSFSSSSSPTSSPYSKYRFGMSVAERLKRFFVAPLPWLTLPLLWTLSTGLFSTLLLSTWFVSTVAGATTLIALAGFSWAVTNWVPFAILGDLILRIGASPSPMHLSPRATSNPHRHLHTPIPSSPTSPHFVRDSSLSTRSKTPRASGSTLHVGEKGNDESERDSSDPQIVDDHPTPRPSHSTVGQFESTAAAQGRPSLVLGGPVPPPAPLLPPPILFSPPPLEPDPSRSTPDPFSVVVRDRQGEPTLDPVPQTPQTGDSTVSNYFDASATPRSATAPTSPSRRRLTRSTSPTTSQGTLSPRSPSNRDGHTKETTRNKHPNRDSIASSIMSTTSSSEYYPPNNRTVGQFEFEDADARSDCDDAVEGTARSGMYPPGGGRQEAIRPDIYRGSSSTLRLDRPLDAAPSRNPFQVFNRGGDASGRDPRIGDEATTMNRTVKVRHSDSFELTGSEASFGFETESDDFDHGDERTRGIEERSGRHGPGGLDESDASFGTNGDCEDNGADRRKQDKRERRQIENRRGSVRGHSATAPYGPDGSDGDDDDDEGWDPEMGHGPDPGAQGGGDQAGVILGCHNIFLVLPQFVVTALSSIIFAILDPNRSVLAHDSSPSRTSSASSTTSVDNPLDAGIVDTVARHVVEVGWDVLRARQDSSSSEADREGFDSLGLIFQIGGLSAAVSTWICFKMWRDREREDRRRIRGRVGYGRAG
ncbi:hypothetical protein JCM10212_002797 [Sporobolomyces blumeae]